MKTIGKYHVFAEIHRGPITTLYKALHPELERIVFIKRLNDNWLDDNELLSRFQQEGLITAKINHPNVISIFDYGVHDRAPFLVIEFIEGITLAEILQKNTSLPIDIVVFIMYKICCGLKALHQKDIVHRDLKPANILISDAGIVKIGDFGFAENKIEPDSHILGTPGYMAPEMILSQQQDERSDIFSLGVVFYEMITGENPFLAPKTAAIMKRIVNYHPPELKVVRSQIPDEISRLCQQMLEKDPAKRPASIIPNLEPYIKRMNDEMLLKYLSYPGEYVETPLTTSVETEKFEKKRRVSPLQLVYAILGALAVIIFTIFITRGSKSTLPEETTPVTKSNEISKFIKYDTVETNTRHVETRNSHAEDEKQVKERQIGRELPVAPKSLTKINRQQTEPHSFPVTIYSDPRAWIIINNDTIGISPVTCEYSSVPETLNLQFKNPGFPLIAKSVIVNNKDGNEFHFSLWQEVGYLKITVNPWGELWIDGDSVDVTPVTYPIILTPGTHEIKIKHPKLMPVQETIFIVAGDTLNKSVTLGHTP